jgi:hypothetical protein
VAVILEHALLSDLLISAAGEEVHAVLSRAGTAPQAMATGNTVIAEFRPHG